MKLNKVILLALIAVVTLSVGLFVINPDNREALTRDLHLYGFSFSVIKGMVFSIILAAVAPSAYFTWRYTQIMNQVKTGNRDRENADSDLEQWEKARGFFFHGNYDKALLLIEGKDSPRHKALHARILMARGDLGTAYSLLSEAYEATGHIELGYLLVDVLEKNGDSPLEILRALVRSHPKDALLARRKLLAHYDKRRMWRECQQTLEELEKAGEEIDPDLKAAYRYEEILADQSMPPKKALEALNQIVKNRPYFVPAALALAEAHMQQGSVEKAFRVYEASFEKTHNPIFLDRIEEFYMEQARPEDAIQIYRELMVRISEPLIRFQLGKLYFKLEMTDECLEIMEPLRGELGSISGYLNFLMEAKARRERWSEALEDGRQLARNRGFNGENYICASCRAAHRHWQARCNSCNNWNTITLEAGLVHQENNLPSPIAY